MYNKRKYYSGYKYPSKKSGSLKRRTSAQFRSAKKGNDSFQFVVNSNIVFSAFYDNTTRRGVAAIPMWEVLARNTNFNHFKSMYDQVRIDGCRVKLNVTDADTTINTISQVKNVNIYVAWDRTGLSTNQVEFYKTDNKGNAQLIGLDEYDNENVIYYATVIGVNIVNCTGTDKSILNSFQKWTKYTSCYPNLLNEKAQYVSTSMFNIYSASTNWRDGLVTASSSSHNTVNDLLSSGNPCVPFESTSCRFKPTLLVGVFSNEISSVGNITQYGNTRPVVFNAEVTISVTFKDMKAAK